MSDLNRMDSLFNKNNSSKLSAAFDETGVEMESNVDLLVSLLLCIIIILHQHNLFTFVDVFNNYKYMTHIRYPFH